MKPVIKPKLPALPSLMKPALPSLPSVGTAKPPTIAERLAQPVNPLDANNDRYTGDDEHDTALDMAVMTNEFAAIRAARDQQRQAIELANDSEYWFAVYFQTREQKEAFLQKMMTADGTPWSEQGDKYLDGQQLAKRHGIDVPPRPAPYKVGKLDKKLTDLT
jgi:hypothetical protein